MNTQKKWRGTRAAAAILAGALAAMTLAMPASAATPNLIDPAAEASLTIHKYVAPTTPTGLPNDGTEQTVALPPLAGVGFTVYKVDVIDLTTNEGWIDASELSALSPDSLADITAAGYAATAVGGQMLTDAEGEISLTGLDLGLYFVVESAPLPGSTGVAPFLVTVPLTDPGTDDKWMYDVHVYPKNSLTNVTKTVEDSEDVKLGDEIEWTIYADIPNIDIIDGYKIVDDLDAKLDYVSSTVTVNGVLLGEGTHYTVTPAAATIGGPTVEVILTEAGRVLIAAAETLSTGELQVVLEITTTVNTVGEIVNTALLYPNAGSFTVKPGEPGGPVVTPEVITKWGGLTILKENEENLALPGAVFSVYPTEADAVAGTNAISLNDPDGAGPLAGSTTFTTNTDGTVTISGLRYSDWADGVAVAPGNPNYQAYWLAEVVAPNGYELLAAPIEFTVTAATTAVGVDREVVNVPSNAGFELPLTGGTGTTLFWAGGAMLLAGAVFLAIYSRRKSNSEA